MIDILFTHSYFLRFDPKEYAAMTPYPPLGTITAAAFLRQQGYSVALHDVMLAESEDSLQEALARHRPALCVIYDDSFNYLTKMCLSRMREAAFRMARLAKERGCIVVIFSSDASDHGDSYLAHDVDYVLCGEAEETLSELADALLRTPQALREIKGIAYREQGTIVHTDRRQSIRDLDRLPMAAWDLVDIESYRRFWKLRHGYFSLNISTTRGCPFHCNWCAKPLYGQVYNTRSPENVVAEMKFLMQWAKPDHLWITDDIFGLKKGWVKRFADTVERENALVPFKCLSRADLLLEEETIHHLQRAGCSSVWIGAESGSQPVLDAMEKGTTVGQIRTATRLLRASNIRVGFFLQFGYPGEEWDDIRRTLKLIRECRPDEIGVSVSYPLPGTTFYDRVREQMTSKQNWTDSQDLDLMFQGAYPRSFYRQLHRVVHKRFSIWRNVHSLRTGTSGPGQRRRPLRSLAVIIYQFLTLPLALWKLHAQRRSVTGRRARAPYPARP